ncbi:Mrp/NBP35 family ATP-binding protein [Bauldia litoralis]|uniref:Iron-sulfur cluster carrier protein n=1 Tax=Bauldia litoralis TaxID=665467 RepID=A0A1G6CGY7_9HYPH|nr:Mrp/NBP35 family ATP-binding protein [Bauldia litoralis]SDB32081.1 ATP-binding protein involved in chromosome partitioning [Bauldia litoralis]
MPDITRDQVLEQLKAVRGPEGGDIVTLGLVSDIVVSGAKVMFSITVPAEKAASLEPLRAAAEAAVRDLPGVEGAMVVLTAEKKGGAPGAGAQPPPRPAGTQAPPPRQQPAAAPARGKAGIPGIDAIVAVASGKGGVGKSTTAVNLALALKANGLRVGILDADIYGPSLPRLLDLKDRKPEIISGRTLRALDAYGVKVMSIGFLVEEETPMIWRGPMVISALNQMMREVEWGDLDILVVDMPPGTGDAQLTMAQQVPLAGAIIVSTPQDLALIDARRGLAMFQRVDVPVLGIIENMSYFLCPHCGERTDIFSHGGARKEAETLGVPFLGEVPLDLRIRETSDAGTPIVASDPESPYAKVYREVATKVWDGIQRDRSEGGRPPPRIVIE